MSRSIRAGAVGAACCVALTVAGCNPANPPTTTRATIGPVWIQVDLPGQSSGFRTAVYDPGRNCLWIITRQHPTDVPGPEFVTLTRVNVADRSVIATPLKMSGAGYDNGSIAIDARGTLWMGWGKTLRNYNPLTGVMRSWNLPPYAGLARLYSMDGRMASLAIDPSGEVWVVASMVTGVFGFNPATSKWDRTINLRFAPVMGTVLAAPASGVLTINGATLGTQPRPVFAKIATSTKVVKMLQAAVYTYVVTAPDQVVYFDNAGNLGRLSLADGTATVLMSHAPIYRDLQASFSVDGKGRVWFPMAAYRSLGVGVLDPTTGTASRFPFPYIKDPGSPVPNDCPPGAFHCIPKGAIAGVGIDAVLLDQRSNVWIITEEPASNDPHQSPIIGPVVELQP
jgi:hypothetical protein